MDYSSNGNNGNRVRPLVEPSYPTHSAMGVKEIPYDYVAVFKLQGRNGNREEDVINISVDGAFMATSVGYSFIPARFPRKSIPAPSGSQPAIPAPPPAIPNKLADWFFNNVIDSSVSDPSDYIASLVRCLNRSICQVDFRYSIIDSASGRELQNRPIHNVAGLGESKGERPFRPFAKPVLFQPRSTIRIVIEELSEGPLFGYDNPQTSQREKSELNIVLHGYKMLGYGTSMP
jgi:hypothetical protein